MDDLSNKMVSSAEVTAEAYYEGLYRGRADERKKALAVMGLALKRLKGMAFAGDCVDALVDAIKRYEKGEG